MASVKYCFVWETRQFQCSWQDGIIVLGGETGVVAATNLYDFMRIYASTQQDIGTGWLGWELFPLRALYFAVGWHLKMACSVTG